MRQFIFEQSGLKKVENDLVGIRTKKQREVLGGVWCPFLPPVRHYDPPAYCRLKQCICFTEVNISARL